MVITKKRNEKSAAPVMGSTGSAGPGPKKPLTKHVAVVMQLKCGTWYSRHYHYSVNVVEVPKDMSLADIRTDAEKASRLATKFFGKESTVLEVQEVQIVNQDEVKEAGARFLSTIKQ